MTDRDTGRSPGFAFLEMPDSTEVERAINGLNGWELDGRAMNVNEARPKAQEEGSVGSAVADRPGSEGARW